MTEDETGVRNFIIGGFLAVLSSVVFDPFRLRLSPLSGRGGTSIFLMGSCGNRDLARTGNRASKGDRQAAVMPKGKGGHN